MSHRVAVTFDGSGARSIRMPAQSFGQAPQHQTCALRPCWPSHLLEMANAARACMVRHSVGFRSAMLNGR